MADGGHLGKSKNRYISAAFRPIWTKFGKATQFDHLERSDRQNITNLKIQDGGFGLRGKSKNRHISAAFRPI